MTFLLIDRLRIGFQAHRNVNSFLFFDTIKTMKFTAPRKEYLTKDIISKYQKDKIKSQRISLFSQIHEK